MIKLKIKYGNSQTDLRFPCTEKEMNAALERIHAEDVTPLELYVSEVVFPDELGCLQDRFVNLDEVNFLAKRMDSFFGDEEYQFYEAMKLEGFDTLPDLINLSFNLNRYPLIQDIGDMGKIGREYLLTVKGCLPADDADDPKYAELGRELIQSGNGIFTEHGMLFVDENTPFQLSYDGQTFPPYLYDPGVLCVAKAEYGGKTEYLYFPCEEEAIDKAFARLGTTADEVKITLEDFNTDSPEWFGRFREIAAEEGVYELNRLTAAVNTADMDLKKLWSVAEYAEAEDAEQLTRLARNIGCFTFIEGATGYAEVGRFFTETEDRYILDLEMEDYFDYEGFGEYISDKFYGKFVDGGFIYNDTDTSLLDILYQDEPNSIELQIRIAEIDAEFKKMLDRVSTDTIEAFDEETATRLMNKKSRLQQQLDNIADAEQRRENAKSRLDDIYTILDGIKNRPMEYDDQIVRQLLECVVVDSKEQITVIFKGGLKSVQPLTE